MIYRWATILMVVGTLAGRFTQAEAALVIRVENAAIRTEGNFVSGGGWNIWGNGRVGESVRVAAAGKYQVIVRAWGAPAVGVWPEMALLVDGRAVKTVTVGRSERADYRFDVDLAAGIHEIAVAFLNDAVIGKEDRNLYLDRFAISPPSGAAEPVLADKQELAEAGEKREREIVAATQAAIEKHRKADAAIRVVDAAGRAMPGLKVSIEQTAHEFLFGCNIYGFDRLPSGAHNTAYKKRFAELFNYATVGFYWRWYEPQRGRPNYQYTDKVVAWCREQGIRMKGHPLLVGRRSGSPALVPRPAVAGSPAATGGGHHRRYRGKIEFWEVVNEPSHLAEPKIDQPYRWARQADPRACLIVNDYSVLADGGHGFFKLLTVAKRNGVPFDGIGIQAHEPMTMRFPLDRVQADSRPVRHARQGLEHHGVHAHLGRAEDHRIASRGRLGRGGPGRLRREVLPRLLCPPGHEGDYLVGLERSGLLAARRRDVAGRHVAQAGLRATQAVDPSGVEDGTARHD